ncbi:MAG: LysM peptidoglycan-binding domain-containing protein [Gemmatimonadales bacterium]|nr:MAG: LysM peptidoglycan-binding domain-containing protein [Gemmatimonadales bacterium]
MDPASPLRLPRPGLWIFAALSLLALNGCHRVGMEGLGSPPPAAPPPAGDAADVATETPRDGALGPDTAVSMRPLQVREGRLSAPDLDLGALDPILHARAAEDPWLRERTEFWKEFWTTRSRGHFERYLDRMGVWQDYVDQELARRGMPASLRYLPIVESGYHHSIRSRAGATGMWQLMPATARGLGLSVDGIIDDRRDPVASTRAALDYLEALHLQFGSWFLALSAYNAGQGRISRILDVHAPDPAMPADERFLRARAHFPAETREFVPRFFAAAALASSPETYDLPPVNGARRIAFEEVVVPDATSLDVVARAAGVDEDVIEGLNPHFQRGFTPPGQQRVVRVPPGTAETFEVRYAQIPPSERISFMEHRVARGETLSHIARRYGISLAELTGSNGNVDPRRLQVGQALIIPVGGARPAAASQVAQAPSAGSSGDYGNGNGNGYGNGGGSSSAATVTHVVSSGESLWSIARRYGMSVADLQRMNGLGSAATIQPGQRLTVRGANRVHTVGRGDTWGGLARQYGVSSADLARANGRTTSDVIRVGEELRIP